MTLLNTIDLIEGIAQSQPSINLVLRDDVMGLNKLPNAKYGAFVWMQGQHSASLAVDERTFRFTFFYVDRIVADKRNIPEVQSAGVDVLGNIIRVLAEELEIDDLEWTIDTFTQRFADDCAGAYATVAIPAPADAACGEIYTHYLRTADGWKVMDADGLYVLVRI